MWVGFEIAGIGKAGISIGADSIGGKLGVGPVSVGVGTGSASGFESLEWDFGVAKQKTTQTGCTITRESWIVGVGVTESETWTDPRCELPPTPTPTPTTPTPAIYPPPVPLNPITSFPVGACVYYDRHFYGLAFYQLQLREGFSYPTAVPSESNSFASGMKVTATQRWIANTVPQPSIRYYWGSDTNSNAYPAYGNASALEADPSVNQKTITYFAGQYSPSQYSTAYSVFVEYYYVRTALGSWTWRSTWTNEIKEFRCPGTPSPATSPPPPNSPPTKMDKACCAMLSEVHQVLATREMLKGKCTFPWRLRMPGGQGEEIIKDYANFLRALAQEIDHLGIHPPKLYIQDNNNAAEGDQTVDIQYPSATSAIEAMMKQVWDDNADGDTRTNFLYRLAWMGIQNSEMTLKLSAKVHALCEAFGVETEVDTATFPVPFNTAAGVKEKNTRGQGFGKNKGEIDKSIDANTELAVERLLPDFLKCRENQVLIERFSGNKDMMDILALILTHVEKLNSK